MMAWWQFEFTLSPLIMIKKNKKYRLYGALWMTSQLPVCNQNLRMTWAHLMYWNTNEVIVRIGMRFMIMETQCDHTEAARHISFLTAEVFYGVILECIRKNKHKPKSALSILQHDSCYSNWFSSWHLFSAGTKVCEQCIQQWAMPYALRKWIKHKASHFARGVHKIWTLKHSQTTEWQINIHTAVKN